MLLKILPLYLLFLFLCCLSLIKLSVKIKTYFQKDSLLLESHKGNNSLRTEGEYARQNRWMQLEIINIVLDKAKKRRIFAANIRTCYINTTFIKSLKGVLPLMKKIFAIFVAMLFVSSLSLAVVGCKKAEAPAPAPEAAPAPAATAVPAPAPAK